MSEQVVVERRPVCHQSPKGRQGSPQLSFKQVMSRSQARKYTAHLVATAAIFAIVKRSTRHIRPIINVKNPELAYLSTSDGNSKKDRHTPLVLDKIVALATWVRPRPAVNDQLARNQRKQNTDAR